VFFLNDFLLIGLNSNPGSKNGVEFEIPYPRCGEIDVSKKCEMERSENTRRSGVIPTGKALCSLQLHRKTSFLRSIDWQVEQADLTILDVFRSGIQTASI
jgi:hypothetical protein